jgi:GNAT superfamily N-acetyltransferase
MQLIIEVTSDPDPADREAILGPLVAYNESRASQTSAEPLAIYLRDPQTRAIIGGLWGRSVYEWLFIELLVVPEALRGQGLGTALMRQAEQSARERGCLGIWLDTFEFQARGFYEKLGYAVFGRIDDYPEGSPCYFLKKRL